MKRGNRENSDKAEDIENRIKDVVSKGSEVSKTAIEKAGNAIQIFTDKSVLKISRSQLISKKNKRYQELGELISQMLTSKKLILSAKNDDEDILLQIKEAEVIQKDIDKLAQEILEKTKELEAYNK